MTIDVGMRWYEIINVWFEIKLYCIMKILSSLATMLKSMAISNILRYLVVTNCS